MTCAHGLEFGCPAPWCKSGIQGHRLVVCGPKGARYFEREMTIEDGRIGWRWVEVNAVREEAACRA